MCADGAGVFKIFVEDKDIGAEGIACGGGQ